jgi:hypothetical protein
VGRMIQIRSNFVGLATAVLALIVTVALSGALITAASAQNFGVIADDHGIPLGAALSGSGGAAIPGEIFVAPNGVAGFVSCDKQTVSLDLGTVSAGAANCANRSSEWKGSLFQHLRTTSQPLVIGGSYPTSVQNPVVLQLPKAGQGCVICEPIDPFDPAGCLSNPACDLSQDGWLPTNSSGAPTCTGGGSCDVSAPQYFKQGRGKIFETVPSYARQTLPLGYYLQGTQPLIP